MSHRKLQKEVDAVFKKINEGIDLFNYYYSRHENAGNDSQRDKFEADLKKEIKRLQKFRDQIKTWQLNDAIEAAVQPSKLQEHRRMVEEAMETYKDVEKSLKMKLYSNQLILLAALELENGLTKDAIEAVEFVESAIETLQEQIETLEQEYERLSQKKVSKKASLEIDERKQEIDAFINRDNFHVSKLELISIFLKKKRIEADAVNFIKDDISFYIESNQEPDFIDDETLYDEIFKEASKTNHVESQDKLISGGVFSDFDESNVSASEVIQEPYIPSKTTSGSTYLNSAPSGTASPLPYNPSISNNSYSTISLQTTSISPNKQPLPSRKSPTPQSPDISSPAIIKTLKPASIPLKPANLKWSAAAAGNTFKKEQEEANHEPKPQVNSREENGYSTPLKSTLQTTTDQEIPFGEEISTLLQNSSLCPVEVRLFSDYATAKVPPGIQEFIVGCNASQVKQGEAKYLIKSTDSFSPSIDKPFLPMILKNSFYPTLSGSSLVSHTIHPPLNLGRFQAYWNNIRAQGSFLAFVSKIFELTGQNTPEAKNLVNELTTVLFYGYYYGYMPMENSIAEFCLFQLGWRPCRSTTQGSNLGIKLGSMSPDSINKEQLDMLNAKKDTDESREFRLWLKPTNVTPTTVEARLSKDLRLDFEVFDLMAWDIYVKPNFKFDDTPFLFRPMKSI